MRLFEHPDFEQAILRAAEHFRGQGLRTAIIEKDYCVTEALRLIALASRDQVIFKGGTSLTKGWNLLRRFSEDVDLFLDPAAFHPALGSRAIDRELKQLRDSVGAHPALTFLPNESQTIGGFGRNDRFSYVQRFGGPGEVANRVLLEAGTASGREPTTVIELRSYAGQYLHEVSLSLGAEDEGPFSMRLLRFRRTFVEKTTGDPGQLPRGPSLRTACLRDRGPLVPVVEATYPTIGVYGGGACGAQVHGASQWRVLVNPEMRPIPMVARQVLAEQPPKMFVVENDDVVEQVAPGMPYREPYVQDAESRCRHREEVHGHDHLPVVPEEREPTLSSFR